MEGTAPPEKTSSVSALYGSFGSQSDFWKDIPDDILLELQSDLEKNPTAAVSAPHESTDFWAELQFPFPPVTPWSPSSCSPQLEVPLAEEITHHTVPANTKDGIDPMWVNNPTLLQPKKEASLAAEEENMGDLTPPPSTLSSLTASTVLSSVFSRQVAQSKQLEIITAKQRVVTLQAKEDFSELQQMLFKLHQEISVQLKDLAELNRTELLSAVDLGAVDSLAQSLHLQQQQVDLYRQELNHLTFDEAKCFATLALVEQPSAQILFKGRTVESKYVIKLIPGAKMDLSKSNVVKASLSHEDTLKAAKPISNEKTDLDIKTGCATFFGIKLNISSRMTPIYLRFSSTVMDKVIRGEFPVKSPLSNPIIVITNESQWGEAAGKLFELEAFAGQNQIPWALFANTVARYIYRATNQDMSKPTRCVSFWEFDFIRSRFFANSSQVKREASKEFWAWFGHVLTTIRFKRYIKALWIDGLLVGLVSKKDCTKILKQAESGTFVVRFSDSVAGSFAVAYATNDPANRVKHYLVKPEDIGSNKALPDFLREKKIFKTITRIDPHTGNTSSMSKEDSLEAYSTKKQSKNAPPTEIHGYVPELEQ